MTTPAPLLICGSMAYDTIMVFEGRFKEQILADQLHILNVSFLVPIMRREWGGCAGNIAYGLHVLGGKPLPMATLGSDGGDYLNYFKQLGIETRCLRTVPEAYTALASITNDLDDNQITAFHPGAMSYAHLNTVEQAGPVALAIVSPDGRQAMLDHAQQLVDAGIPWIFDPGQGLPMFSGEELRQFMQQATYAVFNDYEAKLHCDRTGLSLEQAAALVEALIVTRGAEGAWLFSQGERITIRSVPAEKVVDPTGCGDAFRAGLMFGLTQGMPLKKSAQLASTMGSLKIAHQGGQRYAPSRERIEQVYSSVYGEPLFVKGNA